MDNKKIIISGSSGFLGRHLLNLLKDIPNIQIFALTSKPKELKNILSSSSIIVKNNDIFYNKSDLDFFKDAIVINCAYPRASKGLLIASGLKYTQLVFQKSVDNESKAIINISTQSVYSLQRNAPANEETIPCLDSEYAVGKYAMELLLESICRNSKTLFTNIRIASLIGPDFPVRIVNRFIEKALKDEIIKINESNNLYGFLDVEDAVMGIYKIIESDPNKWKPVYNLGSFHNYTLTQIGNEIKYIVENYCNKNVELEFEKGEDYWNSSLNSNKFYEDFNFIPQISMEDSILKILKAYLKD